LRRDLSTHNHYAAEGAGTRTLELLQVARAYNRWIFDRLRPGIGRRVLEVGCGKGAITAFLEDRDLLVGVDVVPDFVAELNARYHARPGIRFEVLDVTHGPGRLAEERFDSAVSVNVFEHIEDDLAAMRGVFDALQPQGTFALLVPAHPILMGACDVAVGHWRRYTKAGLRNKLAAAGFEVLKLRYSNPIGALGWLVNCRLLRRQELGAVALFDRLVPMLKIVDRLPWPFGLQLIAISRKP
jgi:SAM-dependent methyltransferase